MTETFRELFAALQDTGYDWFPRTPDILQKLRKQPEQFPPLIRFFGLGLPLRLRELEEQGLTENLVSFIATSALNQKASQSQRNGFGAKRGKEAAGQPQNADHNLDHYNLDHGDELIPPPFAISLVPAHDTGQGRFVLHSHWPPVSQQAREYVHCGGETLRLLAALSGTLRDVVEEARSIVDVGCGSGSISYALAGPGRSIVGLDICTRAIHWAGIGAQVQNLPGVRFQCASAADTTLPADLAVFNPPMVVPEPGVVYPHRDGGAYGVELPLLFLEFARRSKIRDVACLATNPIVNGRNLFFDKLTSRGWKVAWEERVNPYFNQSVAKERGYDKLGIERIELWALRLMPLR